MNKSLEKKIGLNKSFKFESFRNSFDDFIPPIIYINSNDSVGTQETIEFIQKKLDIKKINFLQIGKKIDLNEFIENVSNVPLFAETRIFLLKNIELCPQKREQKLVKSFIGLLEDILENYDINNNLNYIIFTSDYQSQKKTTAFIKKIMDVSTLINEYSENKESDLMYWIRNYVDLNNKEINQKAISNLINLCNSEKQVIKKELDKIFLYLGDDKEITIETVMFMVQEYEEKNLFNLIDNIFEKKYEKAVQQYRDLVCIEDLRVPLLYNIIMAVNKLILFKETYSRLKLNNPYKISLSVLREYGVNIQFFERDRLFKQIQIYKISELKNILIMIIELEKILKSRDKIVFDTAFEVFLRKICD
jgi:DNA polymerase-3 subunit delta